MVPKWKFCQPYCMHRRTFQPRHHKRSQDLKFIVFLVGTTEPTVVRCQLLSFRHACTPARPPACTHARTPARTHTRTHWDGLTNVWHLIPVSLSTCLNNIYRPSTVVIYENWREMQRKKDGRKKADSQAGRNALIMPVQCTCQAQWINCDTKGIARSH